MDAFSIARHNRYDDLKAMLDAGEHEPDAR